MSYEAWRFRAEEGADPYALLEEACSQAPTRAAWDCGRGCAHCCHLLVEVTDREAERLVPFVTPAIAARVRARAAAADGATPATYRQPCAFLDADGACLAYEARPLRCRAHVSSDESVCAAVRAGEQGSAAVPGDPWLATVAAAIQKGLGGPLRELHAAVLRAGGSRRG